MSETVQSIDIHGKSFTVPVAELYWRPSTYGIVIEDQKILLVPQFEENRYDLPGGGVDLGELLTDAVIREVKEETGLVVKNPQLLDAVSNFFTFSHSADMSTAQCILMYYNCQLVDGELSTAGFDDEEKEYAKLAVWFPLDKLDTIKIASSFDWRNIVKKLTHQHE